MQYISRCLTSKSNYKRRCLHEFYDKTIPLYIEIDVSGVELAAALYKQEPVQAVTETEYQTVASLGPLHSPAKASLGQKRDTAILEEKHWVYYMALKMTSLLLCKRSKYNHMITNHSLLFSKKDIATLSQWSQEILLRIPQYRMRIIYKPGPDLFIAD